MIYQNAVKFFFAILALAFSANASALNFVTNGSFETPDISVDNSGCTVCASTWAVFDSIQGWSTLSGNGIEIQESGTVGNIDAQEGNQYVELDSHPGPNSNSWMVQKIDGLPVDTELLLSFWYQPRTNNGGNDNGINVYWGADIWGDLLFGINNAKASTFGGWQEYILPVVAGSPTMYLGFAATGQPNTLGGFIDNVSLVPEPASTLLFFTGLVGLGLVRRSKLLHV